MSFVVEAGSGTSGANAYIEVAYADTYHTDRGNSGWTGDDSAKQAAIVRATTYLDARYSRRYVGCKQAVDNALEWPRSDAWDHNGHLLSGVPEALKRATAILALEALSSDLNPTPTIQETQGKLVETMDKADVVEEKRVYSHRSAPGPRYPAAEGELQAILTNKRRTLARG